MLVELTPEEAVIIEAIRIAPQSADRARKLVRVWIPGSIKAGPNIPRILDGLQRKAGVFIYPSAGAVPTALDGDGKTPSPGTDGFRLGITPRNMRELGIPIAPGIEEQLIRAPGRGTVASR